MYESAHSAHDPAPPPAGAAADAADTAAPVASGHLVLVLPDRESAEEVAEELAHTVSLRSEPQLVREALAGEDDAEDAQWLVVLEDPDGAYDTDQLDALAATYEGWLERD